MIDFASLINLDDCAILAKKYSGVVALPLALPMFTWDSEEEFWRIWNTDNAGVTRQHIDRGAQGRSTPRTDLVQWDGLALYEDHTLLDKAAWLTKVSQELRETQPQFLNSIFDLMPFSRIRSVRLWSANKPIPAHYDGNMPASLDGKLQFPAEIRIMLHDANATETFWCCSSTKYRPGPNTVVPADDRYYIKLPKDSNTFAWNNEGYLHGADYHSPHRKILAVIKGWVDTRRLEKLLDQSIEKYPSLILREKN